MRTLSDVLRGRYRPSEGFVATHVAPHRSSPGYGLPGASVTMVREVDGEGSEQYVVVDCRTLPCTLGVGCEDFGVCYALAHGQPEMCGALELPENSDQLPDGSYEAQCCCCEEWKPVYCDIVDVPQTGYRHYCGGAPWCCL